MSAQTVWNRLTDYKPLQALRILKAYGSEQAIVAKLNHYPGKDQYHGHAKGTSGDPLNPAAETNQKNAIEYLLLNAPTEQPGKKKAPTRY
jgi:hypothetical protein